MAEQPRDGNCIFCRIAAGEIPCHRVYEDGAVLAFLDVGPLSPGHTLIIPRGHWRTLDEVPAEVAGACMAIAPRLCKAVMAATGATAWNILQNNGKAAHQAVDHVHFHIIPKAGTQGLGIDWPAGKLDAAEGKRLAGVIAGKM